MICDRRSVWLLMFVMIACDGDDDAADVSVDAADTTTDPADLGSDTDPDAVDASDTGDDPETDAAADVGEDTGPPIDYPDPSFVFEVREQQDPATPDDVFATEVTTHFRTEDALPGVATSTLALSDAGELLAVTATGIVRWDNTADAFELVEGFEIPELVDIADGSAVIVTATATTLYVEGATDTLTLETMTGEIRALAVDGNGDVVLGTADGLYHVAIDDVEAGAALIDGTAGWDVHDLAANDTDVFAATEAGLGIVTEGEAPAFVRDTGVTAVSVCPDGSVLAGTDADIFFVSSATETESIAAEPGGLPTDRVTAVDCDANWHAIGHAVGATAMAADRSHTDHYISRRWVMNNAIRDVRIVPGSETRWIATDDGISRIELRDWTLEAKTEALQAELDEWWWRMDGFVAANARADDAFSRDGWLVDDRDNDGLWTQMMIGGWAMASAVTGDEFYCEEARRAFDVMILQVDIPCLTFADAGLECGFVTRSLVRDDEGEVFSSKETQDNWHLQTYDGRQYYWKDDTSSDEYAGHFYGYPLYYDHCATPEERELMADRMALVMDYIIAGDYLLLDLDGEPTTHGHWDPDHISSCVDGLGQCMADIETCGSACFGGGFLNGAEILGALLATYHMTGQERFYDEYERLIREHRYDEVLVFSQDILTLTSPSIENHSDHELMMLAYHTLIRYEPNEERRAQWIEALRGIYDTETDERNPLWAAFTAGLTGYEFDREAALQTLRELPLDRRQYNFDNSHRLDYVVRGEPDRFGDLQFSEVPPYDEIQTWWWNGNPFEVVQSGSDRGFQGPMAYLLAYWATRYYGLLGEP